MNTAVAAALVQRAFKSAPAKGGQAYAETDVYLVGSVGEDGYGFQLREELERHQVKLDRIDRAALTSPYPCIPVRPLYPRHR